MVANLQPFYQHLTICKHGFSDIFGFCVLFLIENVYLCSAKL
jgi:short subunit fatty acids transporter